MGLSIGYAPLPIGSALSLKRFGIKKKQKQMLRDVVAQVPSKSRRIKNVYDIFFQTAMSMLRYTVLKTEAFPEQANCNGVMVDMSQRKG